MKDQALNCLFASTTMACSLLLAVVKVDASHLCALLQPAMKVLFSLQSCHKVEDEGILHSEDDLEDFPHGRQERDAGGVGSCPLVSLVLLLQHSQVQGSLVTA